MRTAFLLLILAAQAAAQAPVTAAYVRENYSKYEYRIPMRDGAKLFTAVYVPKEGGPYPIMMTRTPYSVRPYG
jgi:predicted acyl esterase